MSGVTSKIVSVDEPADTAMVAQGTKVKPLQTCRDVELEGMYLDFYGFDPGYHIVRYNFVCKVLRSRTPMTIARHRRISQQSVTTL